MRNPAFVCLFILHLVIASPVKRDNTTTTVTTQDFDELNYAAKLSAAAYAGCQGKVEDTMITAQINDERTGAQGFIGFSPLRKRIIVSLRGSDQMRDYRNDLDIRQVSVNDLTGCSRIPSGARVMNGVYVPWKAIHNTVLNNVTELVAQHPDYAIELAGHSLGGSMSYLGFVALQQNFPAKNFVVNALNAFPIANHEFAALASSLLSNAQPLEPTTQAPQTPQAPTTGSSSIISSLPTWLQNLLPSSLPSFISPLSRADASSEATPSRILRRGTERDDGVSNMWSIASTTLTPTVNILSHFGTEFYYLGPGNVTTTPVSHSGGQDANPPPSSGMSASELGATYTRLCQGQRDLRCSAGDGRVGPTDAHSSSFGVRMKTQDVRECVASGGLPGASGGTQKNRIIL